MLDQVPPRVVYLPQDEVMHRFGYEIAIRKLFKVYEGLDTLFFKDSVVGGDFVSDLIAFLSNHDRIRSLVFENTKNNHCDRLASECINVLPTSVSSLSFIGSLTPKGVHSLPTALKDNNAGLSTLTLQRLPLKHDLEGILQAVSLSAIESLVCSDLLFHAKSHGFQDLTGSELGDAGLLVGLPHIIASPKLRTLNLSQTGITKNSKSTLTSLLSGTLGLTSLDLSGNK